MYIAKLIMSSPICSTIELQKLQHGIRPPPFCQTQCNVLAEQVTVQRQINNSMPGCIYFLCQGFLKKNMKKNELQIPEFSSEELEKLKNIKWEPSTFSRKGKSRYLFHNLKRYFVKIRRFFSKQFL